MLTFKMSTLKLNIRIYNANFQSHETIIFKMVLVLTGLDIKKEKSKSSQHPNLTMFRPALFWDTKIEMIDWNQQKRAVIKRIFERGNDIEKKEIVHFYGEKTIDKVLQTNSK